MRDKNSKKTKSEIEKWGKKEKNFGKLAASVVSIESQLKNRTTKISADASHHRHAIFFYDMPGFIF